MKQAVGNLVGPPGLEPGTGGLRVPRRRSTTTHHNSLRHLDQVTITAFLLPLVVISCGGLRRSGPNLVQETYLPFLYLKAT